MSKPAKTTKLSKSPKSGKTPEAESGSSTPKELTRAQEFVQNASLGMVGFSVIAIVVAVFDQLTKLWIVRRFPEDETGEAIVIIPGLFQIVHRTNTGAAFSMLNQHTSWLAIFSLVIAIALIVWAIYLPKPDLAHRWPLALILGGAVGNLIDRFRLKHVVDFLDAHWGDTYHFPTFNVADSAIFIGMMLLIILSFISTEEQTAEAKEI